MLKLFSLLFYSRNLMTALVFSLVVILGFAKDAKASVFHNGWNYSIDSFNDSTYRTYPGSPTSVGGGTFEIYGLAMKDDIQNNKLTFALSGNLGRDGTVVPVANGYDHIGWGDFFIKTYSGLLGVRFTDANDSNASLGVSNVIGTKSVASANDGWPSNSSYTNFVTSKGGNPTLGDLAQNQSPFGYESRSVMSDSQWIGNVLPADLSGIDFGNFGAVGSNLFGFSIDRSLVTPGDIVAWIFQECFNDGIAMKVNITPVINPNPTPTPVVDPTPTPVVKKVPEPSTIIGMIALATMGVFSARNRKNDKKIVVNV